MCCVLILNILHVLGGSLSVGKDSSTRWAKNAPRERFINAHIRFPIRFAKNKKAPYRCFLIFGADDGNRTLFLSHKYGENNNLCVECMMCVIGGTH